MVTSQTTALMSLKWAQCIFPTLYEWQYKYCVCCFPIFQCSRIVRWSQIRDMTKWHVSKDTNNNRTDLEKNLIRPCINMAIDGVNILGLRSGRRDNVCWFEIACSCFRRIPCLLWSLHPTEWPNSDTEQWTQLFLRLLREGCSLFFSPSLMCSTELWHSRTHVLIQVHWQEFKKKK